MTSKAEKDRRMVVRRDIGNRRFGAFVQWVRQRVAVYRTAHACFSCRKSFKFRPRESGERPCPDCGRPAYEMGRSFRTPARSDLEQWRKVQMLFAHGFRFFSYRSYDCAPLPERLRDLERFIEEHPNHPFRVAAPRTELIPTLE